MVLFYRNGDKFEGTPSTNEKGKPFITKRRVCTHCGGAGGADRWAHTGWTCYQCGGSGFHGIDKFLLYTEDQLAKLNATAAKKAQVKAEAAAVEAAKRQAEIQLRRADFFAAYGSLLEKAEKFAERNDFIADVLRKAHQYNTFSESQEVALRNAIERIEAEDTRKAKAQFVGVVGERREFVVEVKNVYSFQTAFGIKNIVTFRDIDGNTLVSKGSFWSEKGNKYTIKATVKDHTTYRDEKQTVIERLKVVDRG